MQKPKPRKPVAAGQPLKPEDLALIKRVAAAKKALEKTAHGDPETTGSLRRDGRGERLTVYLPTDVASELRIRCAIMRRSVSDAITTAVRFWMEEGSEPADIKRDKELLEQFGPLLTPIERRVLEMRFGLAPADAKAPRKKRA